MAPFFDRYTNGLNAAVRAGAQTLLLKPFVWSLVNVQVHGTEHLDTLPTDQAFILVSNHSSHFDTPLLFGGLPSRLGRRMATGAAADFFFTKWYMSGPTSLFFNAFPVERASQQNRDPERTRHGLAGRLLSEGVPLLIFPEGTRTRTGAMGPFKPGSAALCISHAVPAVPAALVGSYAAWPAGASGWTKGRPPIHLMFGTPMWPRPGEMASPFSARLRDAVIQLHDSTAAAYGLPSQAELRARANVAAAITPEDAPQPDED